VFPLLRIVASRAVVVAGMTKNGKRFGHMNGATRDLRELAAELAERVLEAVHDVEAKAERAFDFAKGDPR